MRFKELAATAIVAGRPFAGVGRIIWIYRSPLPARPIPRNNYVPQSGAVFVVDNAKGESACATPTTRTTKSVVMCTPATKLPQ